MTTRKANTRLSLRDILPHTDHRIIQVPAILRGELAKDLLRGYNKFVKTSFSNNLVLRVIEYNPELDCLTGSNFFASNVLAQYIRKENPALDLTSKINLTDQAVKERAVKERVYVDGHDALVLRGTNEFYDERDKAVFYQLSSRVDNLNTPALLTGLTVVNSPKDKIGYGLKVIPSKSFKFTHDDKQFGKEGGWITSNYAVSGLCRDVADLDAYRSLACSNRDGRVVLVSRTAGAPKK